MSTDKAPDGHHSPGTQPPQPDPHLDPDYQAIQAQQRQEQAVAAHDAAKAAAKTEPKTTAEPAPKAKAEPEPSKPKAHTARRKPEVKRAIVRKPLRKHKPHRR